MDSRKFLARDFSIQISIFFSFVQSTRNDIKKLEANFETLRNLERTIQKEADRPIHSLHDKINELKRQIDQLDRRLKDRSEIVEVRLTFSLSEEKSRIPYTDG